MNFSILTPPAPPPPPPLCGWPIEINRHDIVSNIDYKTRTSTMYQK